MGINTITRGMITIFLIGIVYLAMMPTVSNLAEDPVLWEDVTDSRALFLRDNAMLLFYIGGVMGLVFAIVWMLQASSSKGAVSQFG
ncbi:MAG: hypothetical protein ACE5RJ_01595 [Nitrosopumilaceae archaeon]